MQLVEKTVQKVIFEYVHHEQYSDLKVVDIVDFKAEEVTPILNLLKENYKDYLTLEGNKLALKYNSYENTIIDNNFLGKKIILVEIKLNDDCSYGEFMETDMTTDYIGSSEDYSYDISSIEIENRLLECIEENNDCSYIESYSFNVDMVVYLDDVQYNITQIRSV